MEIWKPMQSYEGYCVSNQGRFKSIRKILSISKDSNGYAKTGVSCNGKAKTIRCHREVAICFIPNPDNLPEVNHKNGDKMDCSVSNLEWVSAETNREHYMKELYDKKSGEDNLSPREKQKIKAIENGKITKESGRFSGANNPKACGKCEIYFDNGTSIIVDNLTIWCKHSGIYDYRNVHHVKKGGYNIYYKGVKKWKKINRHKNIVKVKEL
jgi:hypothetical protein